MTQPVPARGPTPFRDGTELDAAELDALVDQVLGQVPRPIAWDRLDRERALTQWAALDRWVRWLVRRYCLDHHDIPPCWYAHSDLVEELSALHTAHRGAYDPTAPADGPAEWHQTLANTRAHLQLAVSRTGCRLREHRPASVIEWAAEQAPDDYRHDFDAHVDADTAERA